jgi:hypothetical protein
MCTPPRRRLRRLGGKQNGLHWLLSWHPKRTPLADSHWFVVFNFITQSLVHLPQIQKTQKDQRMPGSNSRGAKLAKTDTGTMPAKTMRKRKRPKKVDGTSPSLSRRPKGPWCTVFGCTKWAQQGGVCCTHGGKKIRAKCSYVDDKERRCQNVFKRGGLCRVSATSRLSHLCVFCSLTFFVIATEARSIQARYLRPCWMQQGSQAARTTFL